MTNVIRLFCRASDLKTELERALYYSQFPRTVPTVTDEQLREVHALLDHVTGRTCGYVDTEKYLTETTKETIT